MIDRTARNQLATALRRYASGHIARSELRKQVPQSNDPAIRAIADDLLLSTEPRPANRRRIARAIVFLYSDESYAAKDRSWVGSIVVLGALVGMVAMLTWRIGGDRLPESIVAILKMLIYVGFGIAFGAIFLGCLLMLIIYIINLFRPPRAATQDVWPFVDAEQFTRTRATPRLLCGRTV